MREFWTSRENSHGENFEYERIFDLLRIYFAKVQIFLSLISKTTSAVPDIFEIFLTPAFQLRRRLLHTTTNTN